MAFRVLYYLLLFPDRLVPTAEISTAYAISPHHLGKVVHRLGQGGWVQVKRGRGGGLTLGRPADEIRLDAIVRAFEPAPRLAECFDEATNQCCIAPACGVAPILHEALAAFFEVLERHTLADVMARGPEALRQHLNVPRE
jgi:Rrf2 family nitric oxide-sensitive transcriptional repressor